MPCLRPPAPAQHRPSRGIKFCCITWVGSAEANHPIHAWCNATLRRNINILWTDVHYLTRSSIAFVLANGGVTQTETVRRAEATLETSGVHAQKERKIMQLEVCRTFLNPPTDGALKWTCAALLQHLSHVDSQRKIWKRGVEKIDIWGEKSRVPDNSLVLFVDARPSACSAPIFSSHLSLLIVIFFINQTHTRLTHPGEFRHHSLF